MILYQVLQQDKGYIENIEFAQGHISQVDNIYLILFGYRHYHISNNEYDANKYQLEDGAEKTSGCWAMLQGGHATNCLKKNKMP